MVGSCGLAGEPEVLVLAGAMAIWLAWCLASCVPWVRGGSHVAPLTMSGWWRVYAERKLSPWILPGHDGGLHGRRSLLEGAVGATFRPHTCSG
jgi:hypothetical protein